MFDGRNWSGKNFKFGVLVHEDTNVVAGFGATRGRDKLKAIDIIFVPNDELANFDKDVVTIDPTRVRGYEVKTSVGGRISASQKAAYQSIFGSNARLAVSADRMDAAGNIVPNTRGVTVLKVLNLLGLAATGVAVATFDAEGSEFDSLVEAHDEYKANPDPLNKAVLIGAFSQYMDRATGGQSTANPSNIYIYKKLLEALADAEEE